MNTKLDDIKPEDFYQMREDLALALGWTQNLSGHWKSKDGAYALNAPNYFYDDVYREELMTWITSDDKRWFEFRLELTDVLINHSLFPEDWTFERAMASAPQKFYAYAAWLTLPKQKNKESQ